MFIGYRNKKIIVTLQTSANDLNFNFLNPSSEEIIHTSLPQLLNKAHAPLS